MVGNKASLGSAKALLGYAWFMNANAIQGMNAYGIVLNDIGMEPFIDELQ